MSRIPIRTAPHIEGLNRLGWRCGKWMMALTLPWEEEKLRHSVESVIKKGWIETVKIDMSRLFDHIYTDGESCSVLITTRN